MEQVGNSTFLCRWGRLNHHGRPGVVSPPCNYLSKPCKTSGRTSSPPGHSASQYKWHTSTPRLVVDYRDYCYKILNTPSFGFCARLDRGSAGAPAAYPRAVSPRVRHRFGLFRNPVGSAHVPPWKRRTVYKQPRALIGLLRNRFGSAPVPPRKRGAVQKKPRALYED
jgi:hypothetical protein